MNRENIEKTSRKLDLVTRKWWFFLLFILSQFIPPYVSKGYDFSRWGEFIGYILSDALVFSLDWLYPIFKVIPIVLVISIIFLGNRATRLFNVYVAISYILIAFLQSIAVTESYGVGIVTDNLIMFNVVAAFWIWEAIVQENDFTPRKQPIWRYWVIPFAFLAFWMPMNPDTLMPDFNLVYLLTNVAGMTLCMMTPVYLAVLTLYYPRVNVVTLRVTSLIGTIIGLYNVLLSFLFNPGAYWWNGVVHIPLLAISIYGLVLSLKKKSVEETKRY